MLLKSIWHTRHTHVVQCNITVNFNFSFVRVPDSHGCESLIQIPKPRHREIGHANHVYEKRKNALILTEISPKESLNEDSC